MANNATIDLVARDRKFRSAMARTVKVMDRVQAKMQSVAKFARRVLLVGGGAIAGFLKLAGEQEKAENALENALESNGFAVDVWADKLKDAASEIQKLTIFGDEFILSLQAMALNLGISADGIDSAVRSAIGLATALQQDLNSSLKNVTLALQGEFTMLQRYIPSLRKAKTEQEKLAIVLDVSARGFKQAEAAADTFIGRLKQLKNAAGDLGETIGNIFLPEMTELFEKIRDAIPAMEVWIKRNADTIETVVKVTLAVAGFAAALPLLFVGLKSIVFVLGVLGKAATLAKVALVAAVANPIVAAAVLLGIVIADIVLRLRSAKKAADELRQSLASQGDLLRVFDLSRRSEEAGRASGDTARVLEQLKEQVRLAKELAVLDKENFSLVEASIERLGRFTKALRMQSIALREEAEAAALAAKREEALAKKVDDLTNRLRLQIATFGKTSDEIALYKLRLEGATEAQLANAKSSIKALDSLEALQKKLLEDAQKAKESASGKRKPSTTTSVRGSIEGLTDTFRRIQQAAAGGEDKLLSSNQATEKSTALTAQETKKISDTAREIFLFMTNAGTLATFGP